MLKQYKILRISILLFYTLKYKIETKFLYIINYRQISDMKKLVGINFYFVTTSSLVHLQNVQVKLLTRT